MKNIKVFIRSIFFAYCLLCISGNIHAQGGFGNVTGIILDEQQNPLPGASVVLQGTTLGTTTDINGKYTLRGVATGERNIVINYLGYEQQVHPVTIVRDGVISLNITMKQDAKSLDEVVISAVVTNQQRALNQQRSADNLMQVVSSDQIGRFPDLNVAEALQRVSGVTITRTRGEGDEIQLRGTPANFTNIQINGEQVMGAGNENNAGNRNASLDLIPSDILASMEVQKTLLPSNDGDAIAGVVNMRTGTARTLNPKVSLDISSGYNFLRSSVPLQGKASYAQRFHKTEKNPNGAWGLYTNFSYYKTFDGYDQTTVDTWLFQDLRYPYGLDYYPTGVIPGNFVTGTKLDEDGKPVDGAQVGPNGEIIRDRRQTLTPMRVYYRYGNGSRERMGGTVSLDWAPSLKSKYILSVMYNRRSDKDDRNELQGYNNSESYAMNPYDANDRSLGAERYQWLMGNTLWRQKYDNMTTSLEGEWSLGRWKVDAGGFFTYTEKQQNVLQMLFNSTVWRTSNPFVVGTDDGTGAEYRLMPKSVVAITDDYLTPFLGFKPVSTVYLSNGMAVTQDQLCGGTMNDQTRFTMKNFNANDMRTRGQNIVLRANASYNYFISQKYASTLSFGVKAKLTHSKRYRPVDSSQKWKFDATSEQKLMYGNMSNFVVTNELSSNFMNGNLNFGPATNVSMVKDFFDQYRDMFNYQSVQTTAAFYSAFYNSQENIFSGYVMNKMQFNKLMVLIGARLEYSSVKYDAFVNYTFDPHILDTGFGGPNNNKDVWWYYGKGDPNYAKLPGRPGQSDPKQQDSKTVASSSFSYTNNCWVAIPVDSTITYPKLLPNLQLKYNIDKNTILRLAATTGYSRPNFRDLIPTVNVNEKINRVEMGNPALKPAYAYNFDFLFERYMTNVGIISGGVFYKDIQKFLYVYDALITDPNNVYYSELVYDENTGDLISAPMRERYSKNGKSARLMGAEIALNSPLTFLPSFLKNLVFTGNYTYTNTKAYAADGSERGAMRFPGQADHILNLALAYSTKRFTLQAATNYMGKFIYTLGSEPDLDVWVNERWQLDLSGNVYLYKRLNFYVSAVNVLNKPAFSYVGIKERLNSMEYTGMVLRTGFSYKF